MEVFGEVEVCVDCGFEVILWVWCVEDVVVWGVIGDVVILLLFEVSVEWNSVVECVEEVLVEIDVFFICVVDVEEVVLDDLVLFVVESDVEE